MNRKGIVLAGGSGTRLFPLTIAVSKQLMPVYDKPMIYYPLSVLMLAGIREILVITTPADLPLFERLLGDGSNFGISLTYAEQPNPDGLAKAFHIADDVGFIKSDPVALILGDNLFYGQELSKSLERATNQTKGATIFGYHVADPHAYGVVEFDSTGRVVSLSEKPLHPRSNFAVPGLYFYDNDIVPLSRSLRPSARGELEITDLNCIYLERGDLHVEILGRGTAWLDTGTHDSLMDAGNFVAVVEKRQGLKIACLEEIGFRHGWLSKSALDSYITNLGHSNYAQYLKKLKVDFKV